MSDIDPMIIYIRIEKSIRAFLDYLGLWSKEIRTGIFFFKNTMLISPELFLSFLEYLLRRFRQRRTFGKPTCETNEKFITYKVFWKFKCDI